MIIDPHVHLRDWDDNQKETIYHGLETALLSGVGAVFDMPNCAPSLIRAGEVRRRLEEAEKARERLAAERGVPAPLYRLYCGLTAEPAQIREMAALHGELFPAVAGLKLFAGRSTGSLAVVEPREQRVVWRVLAECGYRGVTAVHCEKEELFRPDLWDPEIPVSHSLCRPEAAETASIADQAAFAREAGYRGVLHICHISAAASLDLVRVLRRETDGAGFGITCGATPHHLLMDSSMVPDGPEGVFLKVNPPLRGRKSRQALLEALFDGTVDWIESDHAPHTLEDKLKGFASGIPSLAAWPLLVARLRSMGMDRERLDAVCGLRVLERFGMDPSGVPDYPVPDGMVPGRYPADGWRILDPDASGGTQ